MDLSKQDHIGAKWIDDRLALHGGHYAGLCRIPEANSAGVNATGRYAKSQSEIWISPKGSCPTKLMLGICRRLHHQPGKPFPYVHVATPLETGFIVKQALPHGAPAKLDLNDAALAATPTGR